MPVALLNLQKTPVWGFIPDAWHHQMIYACDSHHVYLTNPLETKSVETMLNELTSESVLLVRSHDVCKRFHANPTSLVDLIDLPAIVTPGRSRESVDEERRRWHDMNVLGQVLTVLREAKQIATNGSGGGNDNVVASSNTNNSNRSPSGTALNQLLDDVENNSVGGGSSSGGVMNHNHHHQQQQQSHEEVTGGSMVDAIGGTLATAVASTSQSSSSSSSSSNSSNNNNNNQSSSSSSMAYVSIPASYKSGICLFAYKDSELYAEIMSADELPLLNKSFLFFSSSSSSFICSLYIYIYDNYHFALYD